MRKEKIRFGDCPKTFTRDQDKALTPEQTIANFYKRIATFDTEILSEVKRIDNGRLDIPVYFSVCTDEARALTGTKKQMGKGASPAQSKASACMELAERFSFFSFRAQDDNFIIGDFGSLRKKGYPVIATSYLLSSVGDTNLDEATLETLLEDIPLKWTWATNITRDEQVLIPFSWFYAINEFNGPSAGNTVEEAALQGISEIVERHVCSLINQYKKSVPAIDMESIQDPVAVELIDKFRKNGIELYLYDFSLDTGMCTVAALAVDRSTFPELSEIVFTAGTTPGPEKAIIRAVTEVAQLAGDFNSGSNYVASGLPKPLCMANVAYLTETTDSVTVQEMNDISDHDMKIEVDNSIEALRSIGMDVFVIDVTHPILQIPAMYTIIPGAHFRERSVRRDAGLFAAKLLNELVDDQWLFRAKIEEFEHYLPESYYLSFYSGISLYNRNETGAALEALSQALEQDPETEDLPYIYSYRAHCLKDLERYDEAIETLKRGCEIDDEREDLHNLLGFCFFKKEAYQTAIGHFERAVEINPSSAMDYANLGVNHNRLGNRDDAIRYFTLALTLDPSIAFAQEQLDALTA